MEFFMTYMVIESFMMQAASSKQRCLVFLLIDVGDGLQLALRSLLKVKVPSQWWTLVMLTFLHGISLRLCIIVLLLESLYGINYRLLNGGD